jgi:hypothetical protein
MATFTENRRVFDNPVADEIDRADADSKIAIENSDQPAALDHVEKRIDEVLAGQIVDSREIEAVARAIPKFGCAFPVRTLQNIERLAQGRLNGFRRKILEALCAGCLIGRSKKWFAGPYADEVIDFLKAKASEVENESLARHENKFTPLRELVARL